MFNKLIAAILPYFPKKFVWLFSKPYIAGEAVEDAIKASKELNAEGIQVYATEGEMSPDNLVGPKKQRFIDMVKDNGLIISALCGDLGRPGFSFAEDNK